MSLLSSASSQRPTGCCGSTVAFLSNATYAFGFDDADCEAPEARHVFRTVAGAYPAAVLIIVPVDNVVTALDAPMKSVGSQNTLGVCLLRRSTGDTVGNLFRVFACFFVNGLSLNGKSLSDMWEIEVAIQFGGNPDFADFDPAVIRGIAKSKIGLFAILEEKADIIKECGLVFFNGEVIMRMS